MWHSELPDIVVGDTTLPAAILSVAESSDDRTALIEGPSGASVSYAQLADRIRRIAGGLAVRGYGPGDVLAVLAPNMPPWAGVTLGAMAAGLAVTPLSPAFTERELTRQVRDAGATIVVAAGPLAPAALALRDTTPVRDVIAIGEAPGATSIFDVLAAPPLDDLPAETPDTIALIPYSSGTTGMPKGVLLSHANLVTVTRQIAARLRPEPTDTMLAIAPFFHILGFTGLLTVPLSKRATVVTMPRFDPALMLDLIDRHHVTMLIGAPPMMPPLVRTAAADLSSLRFVAAGGAPLTADLHRALARRLPGAVVGQGWGLTEQSGAAALPDRDEGTRPGTVGRPVPSTAVRVVSVDTDADLGVGAAGELWVRGPQTMRGYLGNPEATAAMITPDGWVRTGDLGSVDADGNVVIVDRLKELIKVGGRQVAPAELEEVLRAHPAVADAAVLGRPDHEHGEVPVALVAAAGAIDVSELSAWMASQVAPYKRPAAIRLVEAIPRTPSGKIARHALRDLDLSPSAT